MKFSVKLIAAALCAAMLCVPALAAASATGAGAYVPNPQYTVISGTVAPVSYTHLTLPTKA